MVLLDQLSAQYVPVVFAHKLHAQMTEIAGGCSLCHHFNPSHRILPCRDCHVNSSSEDLAKPGLKGAYHRLCMGCHAEEGAPTGCTDCHARTDEGDRIFHSGHYAPVEPKGEHKGH